MEVITELVSNVGFPIAAYVLLYVMINTQLKENTTAINNNTRLMQRILAYLEAQEGSDIDGE